MPVDELIKRQIEFLRSKLIDLTNRNRLTNFKHSDRSRTHIRVIDELPDKVLEKLTSGSTLEFQALPRAGDNPTDEDTQEFRRALAEAVLTDAEYLREIAAFDDGAEHVDEREQSERKLRDRVRLVLGMAPRPDPDTMSPRKFAMSLGIDPDYDLPEPIDTANERENHRDDYLQTLLHQEAMDRKLSGIHDRYRLSLQELGINTLYACFGFLEWTAREDSSKRMLAPLVLQQVDLEKKKSRSRYRYTLKKADDDSTVNLALAYRLKHEYGIDLPTYAAEDSVESYLGAVRETLLSDHPAWQVRRFVTIGHFSFAKLAMYHDLGSNAWSFSDHQVIRELLLGRESAEALIAPTIDVDEYEKHNVLPLAIADADSSQLSAVIDVVSGKNLAVKGPPGTGKSQTITNIIAAAIATKRSVLFVAEKNAALEVVKKRLDDAGIGDFCLELHSTRSNKKAVLNSIESRLEIQQRLKPPLHFKEQWEDLRRTKDDLNRHYEILTQEPFEIGLSVLDVLWAVRSRDDVEERLPALRTLGLVEAPGLDRREFETTCERLDEYARVCDEISQRDDLIPTHPWHGIIGTDLNPFTLGQIEDWARSAVTTAESVGQSLAEWPGPIDASAVSLNDLRDLHEAVNQLPHAVDDVVAEASARIVDASDVESLRQLEEVTRSLASVRSVLESVAGDVPRVRAERQSILHVVEGIDATVRKRCGHVRVREIADHLDKIQQRAQALNNSRQILDECAVAAGIEIPPTFEAVEDYQKFVRLVDSAGSRTVLARTPELTTRQAAVTLERAEEVHRRLETTASEIAAWCNRTGTGPDIEVDELEHSARVLADSGVFAFVAPAYRRAKRTYRAMSNRGAKFNRQTAASQLGKLALYVKESRDFATSREFLTELGPTFRGIESDFASMQAVVRFSQQVRADLASLGSKPFRDLLLMGDSEKILELAGSGTSGLVEEDASSVGESRPGDRIDREAEELERAIKVLGGVQRLATRGLIKPETRIADMLTVPHLLEQLDLLEATRPSLEAGYRVLGQHPGEPVDLKEVETLISYWDRCSHPSMIPAVRKKLLSEAANQELARAHQAQEVTSRATDALITAVEDVDASRAIQLNHYFGDNWRDVSLTHLMSRLGRSLAALDALQPWVRRNMLAERIKCGPAEPVFSTLDPLCAEERPDWRRSFEYVLFRSLARVAYRRYPRLAEYGGAKLSRLREKFVALDREFLNLSQKWLAAELARRPLTPGTGIGRKSDYTELSLLQHEISKQRRHLAIRELMRRAGRAIQELKPCFMMSPLSVAQYLKPGGLHFDVVVIDEASQMKPEDSLSATVRGKQLVVVGDPMQLPPTSFFDRQEDLDVEDIDDLPDNESILDLALGVFRPARDLRWHYRSRDDRLIAFSNHQFYDDKLIVAPRAHDSDNPSTGVVVHDRDFRGTYRAGVNVEEAQLVANAVRDFMARYPHCSLGVVAMNQAQRSLLAEEIESLVLSQASMSSYLENWDQTISPFFVKNLENVQGDERDVIFISTVYGPDSDGRVMQRFGPVNMALGHRRLNVLFTRARLQVRLFTSLRASDIVTTAGASPGVKALAGYLEYAFTGRIERGNVTDRESNEFETWVRDALRARGYEVDTEVATRGYFIDLAVKHPSYPHGYVMGVECDGATYHSSKSARDRDRLRQEVLEGLGWNIYRIWSTDWFADPREELNRLVEKIEEAAIQEASKLSASTDAAAWTAASSETKEAIPDSDEECAAETASSAENLNATQDGVTDDGVQVGDTIEIEYQDEPGRTKTIRIASSTSIPADGQIGAGSPLARAVLGAREGDECSFNLGDRDRYVRIVQVRERAASTRSHAEPFELRSIPTTGRLGFRQTECQPTKAGQSGLSPHNEWSSTKRVTDPRHASTALIADGIEQIVRVEGPIVVERLFRRFANAAGIQRVSRPIRGSLKRALHSLKRSGRLLASSEVGGDDREYLVVRVPNHPRMRLRERGDRVLEEIPPTEIGALMARLKEGNASLGKEALFRSVLTVYGLSRLTNSARKHLEAALRTLGNE